MSRFMTKVGVAAAMLVSASAFGQARVAVLHLAPFADTLEGTAVNIAINGDVTFENVAFKDFVDYTELPAGEYTIDIIPVGATDPAITATVTLEDGQDYSAVAVGGANDQALELLALADDNTAPAEGNVRVRIVHAAPFAADLAATEVSIRTAGGALVAGPGVPYKGVSDYLELPSDTYDLKVTSNDGSVNYIDPLPVELPAGATITVYAFGDGGNQDLGILAFPVGELPLRTPVDNRANGWYELNEGAGQGFILQPIPAQNRVVGSWYTYDAEGAPIFLTFDSCQNDPAVEQPGDCAVPGGFDGETATVALYATAGIGGAEETEETQLTEQIGTIDFDLSCEMGMATVTLDGGEPEMYTIGARLTDSFNCEDES